MKSYKASLLLVFLSAFSCAFVNASSASEGKNQTSCCLSNNRPAAVARVAQNARAKQFFCSMWLGCCGVACDVKDVTEHKSQMDSVPMAPRNSPAPEIMGRVVPSLSLIQEHPVKNGHDLSVALEAIAVEHAVLPGDTGMARAGANACAAVQGRSIMNSSLPLPPSDSMSHPLPLLGLLRAAGSAK